MAAAAQYLRWGVQLRGGSATQSSGTGMALIGRASAGLGARLMSSWVWVRRSDAIPPRGPAGVGGFWVRWRNSSSWLRAILSTSRCNSGRSVDGALGRVGMSGSERPYRYLVFDGRW